MSPDVAWLWRGGQRRFSHNMNTVVLRQAISRITHEYGHEVAQVASMVYCARRSMRHAAEVRGCARAAEAMVKTLDNCVESYCIEHDIHPGQLTDVLTALEHDFAVPAS